MSIWASFLDPQGPDNRDMNPLATMYLRSITTQITLKAFKYFGKARKTDLCKLKMFN